MIWPRLACFEVGIGIGSSEPIPADPGARGSVRAIWDQEGEALSEPISSILGGRAYSRADHELPASV
jgi:hypothetical protein